MFRFQLKRSPRPPCSRRGFNLIEAAIVLGVVGLVIGGIWVAASAVNRNMAENAEVTGILQLVDGLRKAPSLLSMNGEFLARYANSSMGAPAGFTFRDPNPASATAAYFETPMGFKLTFYAVSSGVSYTLEGLTKPMSASQCLRLAMRISTAFVSLPRDLTAVISSAPAQTKLLATGAVWPVRITDTDICAFTSNTDLANYLNMYFAPAGRY